MIEIYKTCTECHNVYMWPYEPAAQFGFDGVCPECCCRKLLNGLPTDRKTASAYINKSPKWTENERRQLEEWAKYK